jgi:hypothetical protein
MLSPQRNANKSLKLEIPNVKAQSSNQTQNSMTKFGEKSFDIESFWHSFGI